MSTGAPGNGSVPGITLDWASADVRRVLSRALDGEDVSVADALVLAECGGRDFHALTLVADELRRRQVGDVATFVVNRNVNFTNVCIKHCTFCAFSRDHREEQGYFLPVEEVVRRAEEAWSLGATEVCIQAGLPPKLDGRYYIDLCRAIKRTVPRLHLHAFSPEEILYGSVRSGLPIKEYLLELKDAGLGTLPGTSAEILDQAIRDRIARGRITVDQWVEVITTAHALGIRTTSTIMYGHVETPAHWVQHMALLRSIQKDTGGFTEFVPLSLIHSEAPMYSKALLDAGANDLGGTLINESISTSAGAQYGQLVGPAELRRWIRDAGRVPAERDTLYRIVRTYADGDDPRSELDSVEDAEARFGSYRRLIASGEFRFTQR